MEKYEPRGLVDLTDLRRLCETGEARRIRVRARASLREVERASNISRSVISRWERGQTRPSGDSAQRYIRVLRLLQGKATAA